MQKILCVGDGFGKGHVWPMWPQILSKVVDDIEVDNLCEIGAGNEFISQCVTDACERKNYDLVLVQWTMSNRLDLINNKQNNIAKMIVKDSTYNTKYSNVRLNDRSWWLSSATQLELVRDYHEKCISKEQHELRSINYVKLVDLYLKNKKIPFTFFSSYNLDFVSLSESSSIDWSKWCDAGKIGMHEYGIKHLSNYKSTEQQPCSMVHLDYLEKVVCPFSGLELNNVKLSEHKEDYARS